MTWITAARSDPLEAVQRQPHMRAHDIVCIHTMVGSFAGTSSMFHAGGWGGTESHFGTDGLGNAAQWQDLLFTADANLDGNYDVISIENADMGPGFAPWNTSDGSAVPAFTPPQAERIAVLLEEITRPSTHAACPSSWACHQGIPLTLVPDSRPGRRGIAYHAQGVPGNGLVAGGVAWSSARGKVCPGARRIAQIPGIIARAQAIRAALTNPTGDDDVSPETQRQIDNMQAILQQLQAQILVVPGDTDAAGNKLNTPQMEVSDYRMTKQLAVDVAELKQAMGQVLAKLNGTPAV